MVPILSFIVSFFTLACIVVFRVRDSRTHLEITYSVDEPEHPADLNAIPVDDRPDVPALYVKVFNRSNFDVRIHNVWIETKRGRMDFDEGLGNLHWGKAEIVKRKPPGDRWYFFQPMLELAQGLVKSGCTGTARFKLVVRDWYNKEHKKTIKVQDIESWTTLHEAPVEAEKSRQSWWQKHFGRC